MTSPSERTLRLLSLLQRHRHWAGADLADRLGVSLRTLRRDVDRLRELGYPVRAAPGVDGGYQLEPGAVLPPLVLDDDEAVAIAVGLDLASQSSVAGIDETSVRALSKLTAVLPRRLSEQVEAVRAATVSLPWSAPGAPVATDVLVRLARLCRDSERAGFGYTAGDGARSVRSVEPVRLVRLGQRWYLAAYDLDRQDWRSFRLDRIAEPSGTGDRFRAREVPGGERRRVRAGERGRTCGVVRGGGGGRGGRRDRGASGRSVVAGDAAERRPVHGAHDDRRARVGRARPGRLRRGLPGRRPARARRRAAGLGPAVRERDLAVSGVSVG